MDQLSAIAAATAAERAEWNQGYEGLLAFSALPDAPMLGELTSSSRWRRHVRRRNGQAR